MTNDKTVTMSRELVPVPRELLEDLLGSAQAEAAERRAALGSFRPLVQAELDRVVSETQALLGAPVVERQDCSALIKIAADLANRHPLRQLYLVCEHQGRINTDSLHEHLDKCGDLLAGIALDIRRAITSPSAPIAVVTPQHQPAPVDSGTHPHNDGLDTYRELNR